MLTTMLLATCYALVTLTLALGATLLYAAFSPRVAARLALRQATQHSYALAVLGMYQSPGHAHVTVAMRNPALHGGPVVFAQVAHASAQATVQLRKAVR